MDVQVVFVSWQNDNRIVGIFSVDISKEDVHEYAKFWLKKLNAITYSIENWNVQ